jgi:copper resistance protein B
MSAAAQEVEHADHVHADQKPAAPASVQPRTPIPALTDADRLAAQAPPMPHAMDDEAIHSYTLFNKLEAWDTDAGAALGWEAEGWIGRDITRLWWRSEGERSDGKSRAAELEALLGRSFAPRWDWVAGLRQELRPREPRTFAGVGVRGLAPQWFEVSAMAYVGEGGRTAARLSTQYSLLFTNRLVLQPMLELNLQGKDDAARGVGSGLGTVEAGLRLRYEITRRFAPYLGVAWEGSFGDTARLRRAAGETAHDTRLVAGLRTWF